jgi:cell division septum initiation protein DivIVA
VSDETVSVQRSEEILRELIEIVEVARAVPMSASVMINRDEVLDMLDEVLSGLPDELRSARWLLKDRDEVRAKAQREADALIADAKSHVAQLVQRQEVVKAAKGTAQQIIDEAEEQSRQMRHSAEDYCDQKLAKFEVILDRLTKQVGSGRRKLAATIADTDTAKPGTYDDDDSSAAAFFDQDD